MDVVSVYDSERKQLWRVDEMKRAICDYIDLSVLEIDLAFDTEESIAIDSNADYHIILDGDTVLMRHSHYTDAYGNLAGVPIGRTWVTRPNIDIRSLNIVKKHLAVDALAKVISFSNFVSSRSK